MLGSLHMMPIHLTTLCPSLYRDSTPPCPHRDKSCRVFCLQADAFHATLHPNGWQSSGPGASWWGLHRITLSPESLGSMTPYSYESSWQLLRGPLLLLLMCFVQRWSQVRTAWCITVGDWSILCLVCCLQVSVIVHRGWWRFEAIVEVQSELRILHVPLVLPWLDQWSLSAKSVHP